ncbi:MAG: sulfite exporter TauE/SafE family protein [Desulfovibrionaceae bacterium]|nr:sulfite exporter TauE/SafE family protein [Desulfovibrionaceae bacterium]
MTFPISMIECSPFLPFGAALFISFFSSLAGISGGFLLLPFQLSILGVSGVNVSATNHLFNLVACPAGVYRFWREGRLMWMLSLIVSVGTVPGVVLGCIIRLNLLKEFSHFKIFVGLVLLYIGLRMLKTVLKAWGSKEAKPLTGSLEAKQLELTSTTLKLSFQGQIYTVKTWPVFFLSLIIGVIGGIYGIGGGAIMSPLLVSLFGLPIYIIAGSTLLSTFVASGVGVVSYSLLSTSEGLSAGPDWLLGLFLGAGGIFGMYLGAYAQKYFPSLWLKILLTAILLFIAARYLFG